MENNETILMALQHKYSNVKIVEIVVKLRIP